MLMALLFYFMLAETVLCLFLLQPYLVELKCAMISKVSNITGPRGRSMFMVVVALIFFSLLDSIRHIMNDDPKEAPTPQESTRMLTNKFLYQRNFYLNGFTLLLAVVIKGLCSLNIRIAELQQQLRAARTS
eukprot:c26754_g1_i1.p1 GENE.c26754_g1_i1~~c26754_g1_i1.p1  ORF type:complete len:146 (+),score=37.78 c26754_g1_i1:48-440(+)